MKFNNWLGIVHDSGSDGHHICSNCGKSLVNRKTLKIGSYGYPILADNGKHDLYAEIQSYADSCDLATILQTFDLGSVGGLAFEELGDLDDFTSAPKTPAELLNVVNSGEVFFNELPVSVRSAFGHSLYNFVSSFGSDDFRSRLESAYGIERGLTGSDTQTGGVVDSSSGVSGGVQHVDDNGVNGSNSSGIVSGGDTVVNKGE